MNKVNPFFIDENENRIQLDDYEQALVYIKLSEEMVKFKKENPELFRIIYDIYFFDYTYWASDDFSVYRAAVEHKMDITRRIGNIDDEELRSFLNSCFHHETKTNLKTRFSFVIHFEGNEPYLVKPIIAKLSKSYMNKLYSLKVVIEEQLQPFEKLNMGIFYNCIYTNNIKCFNKDASFIKNEYDYSPITVNPNLQHVSKQLLKSITTRHNHIKELSDLDYFRKYNFRVHVTSINNTKQGYIISIILNKNQYNLVYYP